MKLAPLGDSAIVVTLGEHADDATLARVRALTASLDRDRPAGVVDIVPAFSTVTVHYDATRIGDYATLSAKLEAHAATAAPSDAPKPRVIEIPVCYGGAFGPDLETLAAGHGMSSAEVVALHASAEYRVGAVGFVPGFGYLTGLPVALHTPRLATPRTRVPAGSVAIGGEYTGVYPIATAGGWSLIGRTPLIMFDVAVTSPSRLALADRVTFRAIDTTEFAAWT